MSMNKVALVLMSALVPTTGHRDLIRFAQRLPVDAVRVLVGTLPGEPFSGKDRIEALYEAVAEVSDISGLFISEMDESTAPSQSEKQEDAETFFQAWATLLAQMGFTSDNTILVGSEEYCTPLADAMNVRFVPYDLSRHLNSARGSDVRTDILEYWENLTPAFKRRFGVRATVFGQESVGKTTVSRMLGETHTDTTVVEEYARPYLEAVGEELTPDKMETIIYGQSAWQEAAGSFRKPFVVQDTDLFSTIGYYRVLGWEVPEVLKELAKATGSDVYFVMPDSDVPFVADSLRYGGDVRETATGFWMNILEEFGRDYVMVPEGSESEKAEFIRGEMLRRFEAGTADVRDFRRSNKD